jgi:hypothetical protein
MRHVVATITPLTKFEEERVAREADKREIETRRLQEMRDFERKLDRDAGRDYNTKRRIRRIVQDIDDREKAFRSLDDLERTVKSSERPVVVKAHTRRDPRQKVRMGPPGSTVYKYTDVRFGEPKLDRSARPPPGSKVRLLGEPHRMSFAEMQEALEKKRRTR